MISKDFWLALEVCQLVTHLCVIRQSSTLFLPLDRYQEVFAQRNC